MVPNILTMPDSYPLPRMEDCVDSVDSENFATKLALRKGQVPLTIGLCNAAATFQHLINTHAFMI